MKGLLSLRPYMFSYAIGLNINKYVIIVTVIINFYKVLFESLILYHP